MEPAAAATVAGALDRAGIEGETRKVIEEVVWEIVPQLAEAMIRERLDQLIAAQKG